MKKILSWFAPFLFSIGFLVPFSVSANSENIDYKVIKINIVNKTGVDLQAHYKGDNSHTYEPGKEAKKDVYRGQTHQIAVHTYDGGWRVGG